MQSEGHDSLELSEYGYPIVWLVVGLIARSGETLALREELVNAGSFQGGEDIHVHIVNNEEVRDSEEGKRSFGHFGADFVEIETVGGLFCLSSRGVESAEGCLNVDMPIAEELAVKGVVGGKGWQGIVNQAPCRTIIMNTKVIDIEGIKDATLTICGAKRPLAVISCHAMHSAAEQNIACANTFNPLYS